MSLTVVATDNNIHILVDLYITSKEEDYTPTFGNIPIGEWDVSAVTNMVQLFAYKPNFNESLENWNVSNVTNMNGMFYGATSFNQNLTKWKLNKKLKFNNMFLDCGIQEYNKPPFISKEEYKNYVTQLDNWKNKIKTVFNVSTSSLDKITKKIVYFLNYKKEYPTFFWSGFLVLSELYTNYLMYKYDKFINEHIYLSYSKFDSYETILQNILQYSNQKIICFELYIPFNNGQGHSNLLIYRKEFNTIEHFEPHGSRLMVDDLYIQLNNIFDEMMKYINERVEKPIKFVSAAETCPTIGLQTYETQQQLTGNCLLWVLLIIDLVFKFPSIPTKYIISALLSLSTEDTLPYVLSQLINGYSKYVYDILYNYYGDIINKHITTEEDASDVRHKMDKLKKEEIIKNFAQRPRIKSSYSDDRQSASYHIGSLFKTPFNTEQEEKTHKQFIFKKKVHSLKTTSSRKKQITLKKVNSDMNMQYLHKSISNKKNSNRRHHTLKQALDVAA